MHVRPTPALCHAAADPDAVSDADPQVTASKQLLLARWPQSVPMAELDDWLECTLPVDAGKSRRPIEFPVTELFPSGRLELRTEPIAAGSSPGERPEVFAASRWISQERDVIPTLYHEPLRLNDPAVRRLGGLIDGTPTGEDLIRSMGGTLARPDGMVQLETVLKGLAAEALLVG